MWRVGIEPPTSSKYERVRRGIKEKINVDSEDLTDNLLDWSES